MENFLDTFLTFVLLYKYVGIFIISYIAAFIFPLPSGTALAAAGAFASQGYLSLSFVISAALLGNIAGDVTGYFLSRHFGLQMLRRAGFAGALHLKPYLFVSRYLQTFPHTIIFFTRFFTQINALVNILAGMTKISPRVFFLSEILGEIAFVLVYGYAGFLLGAQWEENFDLITNGVFALILLGVIITVSRILFSRKGGALSERSLT